MTLASENHDFIAPDIHLDSVDTPLLVECCSVSKVVGGIAILTDLSLRVKRGEILLIRGQSGSGKSTLLRLIEGIEQPSEGRIYLFGHDIRSLSRRDHMHLLRNIGIGFQDPLLDNALSVTENLLALACVNGRFVSSRRADLAWASQVADMLGISAWLTKRTAILSGGQKLRLALARALVLRPQLLLLDEPTHMVDAQGKASIYRDLRTLILSQHLTAVVVSHDDEARLVATRELLMDGGTVVEEQT